MGPIAFELDQKRIDGLRAALAKIEETLKRAPGRA
jgi:hypothetical protein